MLQVGQEHDIVRSALVSAASLVGSFEVPEKQIELRTEFYRNYNMAIRNLRAADPPPTTEALLTACLLFTSFEFVLGSVGQGLVHCRSGLEIAKARIKTLKEQGRLDNPEASFLLTYINPIMTDYALQARAYGTALLPPEDLARAQPGRHEIPHVPACFPSIHQAHHCLSGLIHHIAVSGASSERPWKDAKAQQLSQCLQRWPLALDGCEKQLGLVEVDLHREALTFLRCNLRFAEMLLSNLMSDEDDEDLVSRSRLSRYPSILEQYKNVEKESPAEDDTTQYDVPKMDAYVEGIVPLFIIAITSTKKTAVRIEALRCLKALRRAEANWNSQKAFQVASSIIELHSMDSAGSIFHQSYIRGMYQRDSLPCLHTASVQWVSQLRKI